MFLRRQVIWSGISISLRIFHSFLWSTHSFLYYKYNASIKKVIVELILLDWGILGRGQEKKGGFYFIPQTYLLGYKPGCMKEAAPPQSHSWLPQEEEFYKIWHYYPVNSCLNQHWKFPELSQSKSLRSLRTWSWEHMSESESRSVVSDSLRPPWAIQFRILQARIVEWVAFPFSRGSSGPRSSIFQVDSLPSEPPRKGKETKEY